MRAIVFDIDNTLTPPRRPLTDEVAAALCDLDVPFHLAAGSDMDLVRPQLLSPLQRFGFRGCFDAFVSNGSHRYRCELGAAVEVASLFEFRLSVHLGADGLRTVLRLLEQALDAPEFALDEPDLRPTGPRLINRGGMINLAPIGRPVQMSPDTYRRRDCFVDFDRRTGYRARLLDHLNRILAPWREANGLRICLGGQTSFDIVVTGFDKQYPLRRLLDEGYRQLTYVGDALHPGGNDAAVLDLVREWPAHENCPVDVVHVRDCQHTLAYLRGRKNRS